MRRTDPNRPRDLRSYARSTQFRLVAGALILLLVVGVGLIRLIYGLDPAVLALACIGLGLAPVLLIAAGLSILSWISHRARNG